jgi:REP element-mobilizing transposase RayT
MRIPKLYKNATYHIYNRGVLKTKLYKDDSDYKFFIYKLAFYKKKYDIDLISFCLMPNHFHLLVRSEFNEKNISYFMKSLQQSYACYFNKKYKGSGHVFQGSYKNKIIKSQRYLGKIIQYIAENPVKDKLVMKPEQWPYSG